MYTYNYFYSYKNAQEGTKIITEFYALIFHATVIILFIGLSCGV